MPLLVRVLCSDLGPDAGASPPTEFRIFRAGMNATSKGTRLFDEQAAREVMAAYAEQGVDQMVDLEHDSLDEDAIKRADAKDARAWYKLEVRGGELWAVDVRWTPDGLDRLKNKTQRYISPAFLYDKNTGRIAELVNCALVAMPATHDAMPLVAASRVLAQQDARATEPLNAATRELARLTLAKHARLFR